MFASILFTQACTLIQKRAGLAAALPHKQPGPTAVIPQIRPSLAAAALAALILCFVAQPAAADPDMSEPTANTYRKDSGAYITEGEATYRVEADTLCSVLLNWPSYSEWAVQGLDAHPDSEKSLVGVVKDIAYANHPEQVLVLTYDIVLGWPFGQENKQMRFAIDHRRREQEARVEMTLLDTGITLNSSSLVMKVAEEGQGTTVSYTISADFAWFLQAAMNREKYEKMMRWRVEQVLYNLRDRIAAQHSS